MQCAASFLKNGGEHLGQHSHNRRVKPAPSWKLDSILQQMIALTLLNSTVSVCTVAAGCPFFHSTLLTEMTLSFPVCPLWRKQAIKKALSMFFHFHPALPLTVCIPRVGLFSALPTHHCPPLLIRMVPCGV